MAQEKPRGHAAHVAAPASAYVPGLHATGGRAGSAHEKPAVHATHTPTPARLRVPGAQAVGATDATLQFRPALQGTQAPRVAPAGDQEPAAHAASARLASAGQAYPAGQGSQPLATGVRWRV